MASKPKIRNRNSNTSFLQGGFTIGTKSLKVCILFNHCKSISKNESKGYVDVIKVTLLRIFITVLFIKKTLKP